MTCRVRIWLVAVVVALAGAAPAHAVGRASVASLQVALHLKGVYRSTIDGVPGPATTSALVRFQLRAGLPADGVLGPRTRKALGEHGRPRYGSRSMRFGMVGWDVAALQFLLAWHGFPSGTFDGRFGPHVGAALRHFQTWAGLEDDGIAGPATRRALSRPVPRSPLRFAWPLALDVPIGDMFGPRRYGFHPGVDIPAPAGTRVLAARAGTVVWAGWLGGYGRVVEIAHARGVVSLYAHLRRIAVVPGARVRRGAVVGRVGSTGDSTGPHLHFELRVRGAAVDPLPVLP
jgi:murein DD-endopeptidase MepM/ murein hydrolase activator NlpD